MEIILVEKIKHLGDLGDIVQVKDGYARNYLIPYGHARRATAATKAEFQARRADLEKLAAEKLEKAKEVAAKMNGFVLKLTQKAGVDGRLFGSVTTADIAEGLTKSGFELTKAQVRMPLGPIKIVSDSTVTIALHTDVLVEITVSVYGETA
jgi:large subunit ribosomal protein L9